MTDQRFEEVQVGNRLCQVPKAGSVFGGLKVVERTEHCDDWGAALYKVVCLKCEKSYLTTLRGLTNEPKGCRACFSNAAIVRELFDGDRGAHHRFMIRWTSMVRRCHDTSHKQFPDYGGRGITVCEEWRTDYEAFVRYLATLEGFSEADNKWFQIDRIDNSKGYEPGNLRFVTPGANARNRRSNKTIAYEGQDYSTWDFHEQFCPKMPWKNFQVQAIRHDYDAEKLISLNAGYRPRESIKIYLDYQGARFNLKEFRAKFCPEASPRTVCKFAKAEGYDAEKLLARIANMKKR